MFKAWLRDQSELVQPVSERRPFKRQRTLDRHTLDGPPASVGILGHPWAPALMKLWNTACGDYKKTDDPAAPHSRSEMAGTLSARTRTFAAR